MSSNFWPCDYWPTFTCGNAFSCVLHVSLTCDCNFSHFKCNLFLWWQGSFFIIITPVCVTSSFRYHYNVIFDAQERFQITINDENSKYSLFIKRQNLKYNYLKQVTMLEMFWFKNRNLEMIKKYFTILFLHQVIAVLAKTRHFKIF